MAVKPRALRGRPRRYVTASPLAEVIRALAAPLLAAAALACALTGQAVLGGLLALPALALLRRTPARA